LSGALAPGSEISQLELSRRLSVSRTPLREALKLLESEGLVLNRGRHKAIEVSPVTMSDLDDLYSMRVLGEALAVWLTVSTLRQKDLDGLRQELDAIASASSEGDRGAAHRRFHAGLRAGAGPRLADHLDRLFQHAERYQRAFMEQEDVLHEQKFKEHLAILEACRAGDRALARDLLVDHTSQTAMLLMTRQRFAPFALPTAVAMAKSNRDGAGQA
jgi:DNA-binding GntR family transcriptional regulator